MQLKHPALAHAAASDAVLLACRRIAEETGGHYKVALSEQHLQELLLEHSPPPPTTAARAGADLVSTGLGHRLGLHTLDGRLGANR